jgi:hypothetical protein
MNPNDTASLEERVGIAYRRLVLMHAALNAPDDVTDEEVVGAAIAELASDTAELLRPLTTGVPAAIANYTPRLRR